MTHISSACNCAFTLVNKIEAAWHTNKRSSTNRSVWNLPEKLWAQKFLSIVSRYKLSWKTKFNICESAFRSSWNALAWSKILRNVARNKYGANIRIYCSFVQSFMNVSLKRWIHRERSSWPQIEDNLYQYCIGYWYKFNLAKIWSIKNSTSTSNCFIAKFNIFLLSQTKIVHKSIWTGKNLKRRCCLRWLIFDYDKDNKSYWSVKILNCTTNI